MVKTTKLYNSLIWFVSVFVPLVVALLLFTKWSQDKLIFDMRFPNSEPVVILDKLPFIEPLTFLPPIYAVINRSMRSTCTAQGRRFAHPALEHLLEDCAKKNQMP